MLLTLVIILILIWSAVVWSLYSNFLVFYSNFSETENYNKAYYASISAIERAQLVLRQHQPWYEWSWWWIKSVSTWSYRPSGIVTGSDTTLTNNFSYLSNNHKESSLFWEINSRTDRIPATWKWDVDLMMSTWDSINYNKMDYENSEIILLYYDSSDWNPYHSWWISMNKSNINRITAKIRLPWLMSGEFWELDTNEELDISSDSSNDAIVNRQIKWYYLSDPFTIFSTQLTGHIDDSIIRESTINKSKDIKFDRKWNPLYDGEIPTNPNIISPSDNGIKSNATEKYKTIFTNDDYSWLELKFSLLNILKWRNGSWTIYPFLEYNVNFSPNSSSTPIIVPEKYYTIKAIWWLWDYLINTIIYKPATTESILRSFTTIL